MRKILLIISLALLTGWVEGKNPVADTLQCDSSEMKVAEDFASSKLSSTISKEAGDSAYLRNDFQSAIQIYESLLKEGESAEVYYNLGNSYYKEDDIARAILNYERALLLSPGNSDIRANLDIARSKTIDKVTPVPEVFFVSWFKSLINWLSIDEWAHLSIAFFILFLISLWLFFYSKFVIGKKIGFVACIVLLLLVVFSNIFAFQQKKYFTIRDKAIVLAPSITVRSTPSESGTSLFILHEGHKVKIEDDSMREWKEISLEDGKVGWLPSSSIEVI